ncbi:MAG: aspartate-alanine antiporter [Muribaculaceae bacterium]|nr:aspartate-alanine antiporter [Muribaculaceae bacterium]
MDWLISTFRENPAIPIFLTIGIGFWIGQLKWKTFSLGTVTSVLLVGVLVGQMDIEIPGPMKAVFFLLFLFSIGFSVGPQFVNALKGSGIKQVIFAVVLCVLCLVCTWGCAKILGYNAGEAAGLLAGAQTISAVIGVADSVIPGLGISKAEAQQWIDLIPVCYAVTYIFGTIGSAYILGNIGPALLGGLKKVKEQTRQYEQEMSHSTLNTNPGFIDANRPISFRAYKAESDWFDGGRKVSEIEDYVQNTLKRRVFVDRVRINGQIPALTPDLVVNKGDEIVLSGRREYVIQDESWVGQEVIDNELLSFPVEKISVLVSRKGAAGMTVDQLRAKEQMYGVVISSITRAGVEIPVMAQTTIQQGDTLTIGGLKQEVDAAAAIIGYADRPSTQSNMIMIGLGIFIGALIGAITLKIGNVPLSLSTSGGALIAGLFCGWLRSRRPDLGGIPQPAIWMLDNMGLNMFIAVIGITAGPTFVSGIKEVGFLLFVAGIVATSLPLFIGIWMGNKVFKFHPAITLGCCAGGRTTTAALGAIQSSLDSSVPALGYTVTYAIGNTLLIFWGVVIVLLMV